MQPISIAIFCIAVAFASVGYGPATAAPFDLLQTIVNPTPASGDFFGPAVAGLGGDILVGASGAGAVYRFDASGSLLQTVLNPTPAPSDQFGQRIASEGSGFLVGAPQDDTTGVGDAGAAYLFDGAGMLSQTFLNPAPGNQDFFGNSVAAFGNNVLIGATKDDNVGGADSGRAFLFDASGTLLQTFANPSPSFVDGSADQFGISVAAVGSNIVVGANGEDVGATDAAYLFDTAGSLITTFANPNPGSSDGFGASLAAVGNDRVLIGAPLADIAGNFTGAAYLFDTSGNLLTTFPNPTPASFDRFGVAVAAVGDTILIGATADDTAGSDAGAAYLFDAAGTLLHTFLNPTPASNDLFGQSLVQAGNNIVIGAPGDDAGAANSGVAYLFEGITIPGMSQDNPILPTGGPNPDGSWTFNGVPGDGQWFDPVAASGYVYATDGLSNFTDVGLPTGLGDLDGFYTITDGVNPLAVVAAGAFHTFATAVDQFTITGIDPTVDGEDPLAFPTFLAFDQTTVSFTMTPIPEPSSFLLAVMGLVALVAFGRRRGQGA